MNIVKDDVKVCWVDLETGGVDSAKDAVIQIAAILTIGDSVVDKIDLKVRPMNGKPVSSEAIATHGMDLETIKGFMDPIEGFNSFYKMLSSHGPKSKQNRYLMAGYNSDFDLRFLSQWFQDITGGPYKYWDYLQFSPIDVLPTVRAMKAAGILTLRDCKLETVCNYFGIKIAAHDAMSDIQATMELTKLVYGRLWDGWYLINPEMAPDVTEKVVLPIREERFVDII